MNHRTPGGWTAISASGVARRSGSIREGRLLTFSYAVGTNAFDYEEVTLFVKTGEVLADETLTVELAVKQPWGQSGLALEASHFFADPARHRIVLMGTDVRVYRGLSLSVSASASRISFGVAFTFGSAYNNVVNSRVGGSSGRHPALVLTAPLARSRGRAGTAGCMLA